MDDAYQLWLYWEGDGDDLQPVRVHKTGTLAELEAYGHIHYPPDPGYTWEIVYPNGRLRSRLAWNWER